MGEVLKDASKQLYARPDDEIHPDFPSLIRHLRVREADTFEVDVVNIEAREVANTPDGTPVYRDNIKLLDDIDDAEFDDIDSRLAVQIYTGREDFTGNLNDWSFGQLCGLAGAPKSYLNRLPVELAARNLNHGLLQRWSGGCTTDTPPFNKKRKQYESGNGTRAPVTGTDVRAFYSDKYERLPDLEVAETVEDTARRLGYEPAGRFAGVRVGMPPVRPEASGLYASDRDVFLFIANEERGFDFEGDTYYHCAIVWNSEVTFKTHGWLMCLYRGICGNHLIWDAEEVYRSAAVHRGSGVHDTLTNFVRMMEEYDRRRNSVMEISIARLTAARVVEFADTRERVAERLAEYVQKQHATAALPFLDDERACPQAPHSTFGVSQALTLYSQTLTHSSMRDNLDRSAGRIITDGVGF